MQEFNNTLKHIDSVFLEEHIKQLKNKESLDRDEEMLIIFAEDFKQAAGLPYEVGVFAINEYDYSEHIQENVKKSYPILKKLPEWMNNAIDWDYIVDAFKDTAVKIDYDGITYYYQKNRPTY